jgi:poly(A) polymerase/tRNA nucleotidyltransferase (CCA-adding enzyme)
MQKIGVLRVIMPELSKCVKVTQDKRYHKYDVFSHCLYTCDNIDRNIILRLTAILHDVGKKDTRKMINNRVTFHKHEMASVKLAKEFLNRLKYSNAIKKEVLLLVRLHMYHYTREYTDAAIRRFIKKARINDSNINNLENFPLFKIRAAERLGNGLKNIPVTKRQKDFQERIVRIYNESNAVDVNDLLVDGRQIMKIFRIDQSPLIGKILDYLLSKVIEKPKYNNKLDLLKLTVEYLVNEEVT